MDRTDGEYTPCPSSTDLGGRASLLVAVVEAIHVVVASPELGDALAVQAAEHPALVAHVCNIRGQR